MPALSISDLNLKDKKALLRVDFNVPLKDDGSIADLMRISESLPTIQFLLDKGSSIIILSHLGRPKGKDLKYSLKPCAEALSNLLKKEVFFASDCLGEETKKKITELKPGNILLLENLRFYQAEEKPESDVDILVELDEPLGLMKLARLNYTLEDALGKKVDLIKSNSIKPSFRDSILRSAIYIYG